MPHKRRADCAAGSESWPLRRSPSPPHSRAVAQTTAPKGYRQEATRIRLSPMVPFAVLTDVPDSFSSGDSVPKSGGTSRSAKSIRLDRSVRQRASIGFTCPFVHFCRSKIRAVPRVSAKGRIRKTERVAIRPRKFHRERRFSVRCWGCIPGGTETCRFSIHDRNRCLPWGFGAMTLTGRGPCYSLEELLERDKANLDLFWLKDKQLIDMDNLPEPDDLAEEIIENLIVSHQVVEYALPFGAARTDCPLH